MATARNRHEHTLIIEQWLDSYTARAELDGAHMVELPRALLPHDAASDTVLHVACENDACHIIIDVEETRAARARAAAQVQRLRRRDPGGDVAL